jgi:hypothetical protein
MGQNRWAVEPTHLPHADRGLAVGHRRSARGQDGRGKGKANSDCLSTPLLTMAREA